MSLEDQMVKALGSSFTQYVGKDEQLRQRALGKLKCKNVPVVKEADVRPKKPSEAEVQKRLEELRFKLYVAGKYSFQRVFDVVCAVYGVSEEAVLSARRTGALVRVRQQIVRVLRDKRSMSYLELGRRLNRDHSTLIHAYNSARSNKALQNEYEEIIEKLENYSG